MTFIADLHVHSKYSRATAKNLDLEHLYIAARQKGITVVATGDFTHPAWFEEIREKLVPAAPGLLMLKEEIRQRCDREVPASCPGEVRFMLETEISNIYKKDGRTRKNHNLIYVPDLETANALNTRLDAVGNIRSDGRPILGLDARDLLEIMLECSEEAFLIPAHIWTPWFSLLGSKSGFDTLASCFGDLSDRIFAVETGLSSDPPMNWRVSELDTRTLVSNSDAHSPANLGRNANIFNTDLSFFSIREALVQGDPARCMGTIDMYPEEGKYHMDGHRKCSTWRHPSEGAGTGNLCPVCGAPMTLGVLHRVEAIADRPDGVCPPGRPPFHHLIPLAEILSEIFGVGVKTKTVDRHFQKAIRDLGPELFILKDCPIDKIRRTDIPLLGEAIDRMRSGRVHISPGYDGEYGRVRVFGEGEKEALAGQTSLFAQPPRGKRRRPAPKPNAAAPAAPVRSSTDTAAPKSNGALASPAAERAPSDRAGAEAILQGLNDTQQSAVVHQDGPILIIAGPGTGKTRTLTHRIAYLMQVRRIPPDSILAVTFTNKAAREMAERLKQLLSRGPGGTEPLPAIRTFHGFCLAALRETGDGPITVIDEHDRALLLQAAVGAGAADGRSRKGASARTCSERISLAKQHLLGPEDDLAAFWGEAAAQSIQPVYRRYQAMLAAEGLMDYDDLIMATIERLTADPGLQQTMVERYRHVLVDEYQDINPAQYRLIRTLCPGSEKPLFAIGDPDQSIYGFRGSDVAYFQRFQEDYPDSRVLHLRRNYRSAATILDAAHQVIRRHSLNGSDIRAYSDIQGVPTLTVIEAPSEKSEAVAVGRIIESMVGGFGFQSIDFGGADARDDQAEMAFSDFGVLYRSHAQGSVFADVFQNAGIPWQMAHRESIYRQPGLRELLSLFKLACGRGILNDFENLCRLPAIGWKAGRISAFRAWYHDRGLTMHSLLESAPEMPAAFAAPFDRARRTLAPLFGIVNENAPAEALTSLKGHLGLGAMIDAHPRRTAALESLVRRAAEVPSGSRTDFIDMAALDTDADVHEKAAQKVTLMTFHAAKGLEFPVVFIVGCEDGFVPLRPRGGGMADPSEERRLFYVGMTRAMHRLFLSSAASRTIHGRKERREISPFVQDIERRLISRQAPGPRPSGKQGIQMDLFSSR